MSKPDLGQPVPWPEVAMALARAIAQRSKDATTRVGACVVGPRWEILGMGFNGFPRNAPDRDLPNSGPERHLFTTHAEVNSIDTACAAVGAVSLPPGSMLFTTHRACAACVKTAFHHGISDIFWETDELDEAQNQDAVRVADALGIRSRKLAEAW